MGLQYRLAHLTSPPFFGDVLFLSDIWEPADEAFLPRLDLPDLTEEPESEGVLSFLRWVPSAPGSDKLSGSTMLDADWLLLVHSRIRAEMYSTTPTDCKYKYRLQPTY